MAGNKYSFKLKSDLSELKTLCRHIEHYGQTNGLSEIVVSEVNICLDELFTNIVLYGFKDDLEHNIRFKMDLDDSTLMIRIEDNGMPFNPLLKKCSELPVDIDNAKIGDLGLHIVKKLMDDIRYERKSGRNKLTLKKVIHSASHLYKSDKPGSIPSNYYA
ncbi:MAG: ATP-binding protein [Deltaproteobacteria bacterium]|jgi:anti-sigma regulatory factor (Ser/Thr protein kinase)|nr:ATP-binding protein [Deltaproteobacteria bacterium]